MRRAIAAMAAGSIALVALAVAAPSAEAAPVVGEVSVCLTVTPKSVSVTVEDTTIGSPTVEQPRTCVIL